MATIPLVGTFHVHFPAKSNRLDLPRRWWASACGDLRWKSWRRFESSLRSFRFGLFWIDVGVHYRIQQQLLLPPVPVHILNLNFGGKVHLNVHVEISVTSIRLIFGPKFEIPARNSVLNFQIIHSGCNDVLGQPLGVPPTIDENFLRNFVFTSQHTSSQAGYHSEILYIFLFWLTGMW